MKRILVMSIVLFIVGSAFALILGGCEPVPIGLINVKSAPYNAIGNGIADDTNAIQSAMNALVNGDSLYFPAGTYLIGSSSDVYSILHFAKNNITWYGDGDGVGAGSSIIKVVGNCGRYESLWTASVNSNDSSGTANGLVIRNIRFDQNINNVSYDPEVLIPGHGGTHWNQQVCILIYSGTDVYIHNATIANSCGIACIGLNGTVDRGRIDHVTFTGIGTRNISGNDLSCIYIQGSDCSVTNCNFTCPAIHSLGGITAIELHGTRYTATGNIITNFDYGMNVCGLTTLAANCLIDNNTITGCDIGFALWTSATPYGFDYLTISNNDITVNTAASGYEQCRGGIVFDTSSSSANHLTIDSNTITTPLESSTTNVSTISHAIGMDWPSLTLANSTITNNVVTNFPENAIRLNCGLTNVAITGNTFIDCGSTKLTSMDVRLRTPVYINGALSTVSISGNNFTDNLTPKRDNYYIYATASTSTGFTITDNSFTGIPLTKQIEVIGNVAQPLITGTITGFIHPTGQVKTTSRVIDGNSVWTTANGTTWIQTVINLLNVKDYGALGNGSHDDTAAIQSAINALNTGYSLYFPNGTYIVANPTPLGPRDLTYGNIFELPAKQNIKIYGESKAGAIIKVKDGAPFYFGIFHGTSSSKNGLEVYNLTFDHNILNQTLVANQRGAYDANATYGLNDEVTYGGSQYFSMQAGNKGNTPYNEGENDTTPWRGFVHEIGHHRPQYSIYLGGVATINIHDINIKNACSWINILIEGSNSNITVTNVTATDHIGQNQQNMYFFDTSFFNIQGTGLTITNNTITGITYGCSGARTAMEVHGNNALVQNNTVTNFGTGVLPFSSPGPTNNFVVTLNNYTNVGCGVGIWSAVASGITGMEISHNTIVLAIADVPAAIRTGILIDTNSETNISGLQILNNDISLQGGLPASGATYAWWFSAIKFLPKSNVTISNSLIQGNTFTNMPQSVFQLASNITNLTINNNTMINCGSTIDRSGNPYGTAYIWLNGDAAHTVNGLTITNNIMHDTIALPLHSRVKNFIYLNTSGSTNGLNLIGNTYTIDGDKSGFDKQIYIKDNITVPLITETIAGFVPPTGNVNPKSIVIDGIYKWTTDGVSWTKT